MAENEMVDLKRGDRVWFVRPGEAVPRPAVLLSDGICEQQKLRSGQLMQYAHLLYGTMDPTHTLLGHPSAEPTRGDRDDLTRAVSQRQTHEGTYPWDPTGQPNTWHLMGECDHLKHPEPIGDAPMLPELPEAQ